jgi:crotonobetainyl-CoA:carnitine CoA-transferase CaiB-like acyl-CoA transferase
MIRRMMDGSPLAGLRILECGGVTPAFAGRLLADGGADVVRVAPPAGDPLSSEPPFFGSGGPSIQETWYNAGKRTVRLDLESEAGRQTLLELIAGADILIEDWSPATPPFDSPGLERANPALTRVSVTPMGLDGPLAGIRTNDLVANALCGSASVTGNARTGPISGYGNQTHHTAGWYAAVCSLAALRAARATGSAQRVDLSAHEALVSCTEQVLMEWFFPKGTWKTSIAPRQGSLHWSGAYEIYPARDGHGVMVTASLKLTEVLVPWLMEDGAAGDLADPEKFPGVVAMVKNLPYVMSVLREWVAARDGEDLFFEAQRRHQPFGVVWNVEEALTKSPQIAARGYLQEREVPGFGSVAFPGRMVRTSADGPHPSPGTTVERVEWPARPRKTGGGAVRPSRPLEGVRVLDFTHVLAGPFGTRVLADLGADVIKVGTAARSGGANSPDHPYYLCWNRNKRSVAINMASEAGRDVARRLAGKSDLIIENFSAGVLKRWGLDRDSLRAGNPGISVISMGGMGQDGPWKDFVTYAPTIHALTGLTYLTNPPGEHTLGYGFSLTDHLSGLAGALAALQALEYRDRTGQGLSIDLSQYELGLGIMAPALLDYLANGANPEPVGNRHPFGAWAPHGIYRCVGEDTWVAIAARGDEEWQALARLIGGDGLAADLRFAAHANRVANEDALDALIGGWTRGLDRYDVARRCQDAGIAAGPVQDAGDLAGRDEQLASRGFFTTVRSESRGEYGLDRFPARFNGECPPRYDAVHEIGADTFDVLTGLLGYSDDEAADLLSGGALS